VTGIAPSEYDQMTLAQISTFLKTYQRLHKKG
jgi:hypothetical protein